MSALSFPEAATASPIFFTCKEDLACALEGIEGFLRKEEAYLLYQIASNLPKGAVAAEIGSWLGRSSVAIAFALRERNGKLHTIDDHRGITGHEGDVAADTLLNCFLANVERAGMQETIEHHRYSSDALAPTWRTALDFLFIDGDHRYAAVQRDIANYAHFVKPGGWIAFHDTGGPEVSRAIKGWAEAKKIGIAAVERAGTILAVRLPGPGTKRLGAATRWIIWRVFNWAAWEIPPASQPIRKIAKKMKKSFARRFLKCQSAIT
jgi:predicted O-methyltransferase YrrM